MNTFLVDLVTVTIVLGIMIFVHEWGHFMAAKLCGVRVDVFSLGFGPRIFGVKRGDTDYRLTRCPSAVTCAWPVTIPWKNAPAQASNSSRVPAGSVC